MTSIVLGWRSWFGASKASPDRAGHDDALIARLRAGDSAAIGEAYDAFRAPVRAFARSLVGDDAAADDLVQEVFIALPAAAKRFRGDSSLGTFLISIAVNHARNHVRAAVRRRKAMEKVASEPLTQSQEGPEDDSSRRQLALALTRALDAIPLDQRVAFVLCEVEERTSADAAALIGVPEGTVRTRLFHAKKRLRDMLEAEGVR